MLRIIWTLPPTRSSTPVCSTKRGRIRVRLILRRVKTPNQKSMSGERVQKQNRMYLDKSNLRAKRIKEMVMRGRENQVVARFRLHFGSNNADNGSCLLCWSHSPFWYGLRFSRWRAVLRRRRVRALVNSLSGRWSTMRRRKSWGRFTRRISTWGTPWSVWKKRTRSRRKRIRRWRRR